MRIDRDDYTQRKMVNANFKRIWASIGSIVVMYYEVSSTIIIATEDVNEGGLAMFCIFQVLIAISLLSFFARGEEMKKMFEVDTVTNVSLSFVLLLMLASMIVALFIDTGVSLLVFMGMVIYLVPACLLLVIVSIHLLLCDNDNE